MRESLLTTVALLCLLFASCSRTSSYYIRRGNELYAKQKYSEAALNYRKALQQDARSGEACYRLGLAVLQDGKNPREAYHWISLGADLLPDNLEIKVILADLSIAGYLGDRGRPKFLYEKAAQMADQLVQKDPKSFDGLRLKGTLFMLDRKPEEASALFRRSLATKPDDPAVLVQLVQTLFQTGNSEEAQQLALSLIGRNKTYAPAYDVLFLEYMAEKRFTDAEKVLKLKVENNPKNPAYIVDLARHYWSAGRSAEAVSAVQTIVTHPADFPDGPLYAGRFYSSVGDWKAAREQFEAGLGRAPKSDRIPYQRGLAGVLVAIGQDAPALDLLNSILQSAPEDSAVLQMKAELLLRRATKRDLESSIQIFAQLLQNAPAKTDLRYELGRAYLAVGDVSRARAALQSVIKLDPSFTPAQMTLAETALRNGNYEEARTRSAEIVAQDPKNRVARLLQAEALIGAGNHAQAHEILSTLTKDPAGDPRAQVQLGLLFLTERKYKNAEDAIRQVYQPGAKDPTAAVALARVLSAEGKAASALDLLQNELKRSPDQMILRKTLAAIALNSGSLDMALDQFAKLISQQPDSAEYRVRVGEILQKKGDQAGGIQSLKEASRLAPRDPLIAAYVADALRNAGRREEAKQQYRFALTLQPDNPVILNNLAFLLCETGGDLDEALRMVQTALQKAPNEPVVRDTLGWVYLRKGMTDSAVQTFQAVVLKAPGNPTFQYHLAMALLRKGAPDNARQVLTAALQLSPSADEQQKIKDLLSHLRQ